MVTEPLRILVAIHGHERDGFADEVRAALSPNPTAVVRVLVVGEPRAAAFTSLLPAARRRYLGAVRLWREIAAAARRRTVDALVPRLPVGADVVHAACRRDAGHTIVEHTIAWPAHMVIVGRETRAGISRFILSPVHVHVVREAPCTVVVVPATASAPVPLRHVATDLPR
jgi:nucleotide-binding universal stress UspA family protein